MANERVTEDIVRDFLKKNSVDGQILEEQSSADPKIKKALAQASKKGLGAGKPEFILRLPGKPDLVVVFECKKDKAFHQSVGGDHPVAYAVDGVLLYATHLSRFYDVIAVAVSGTKAANLSISTYRHLRNAVAAEPLLDEYGPISRLVPPSEYGRLLSFDPAVRRRSQNELMTFSQALHNDLRDYAKLSENEKPLAVSGCLLALRDDAFKANWRSYTVKTLGRELIAALRREIEVAVPEVIKQRVMLAPYSFLDMHPELNRVPPDQTDWPLRSLVEMIEDHVRPFIETYNDIDVIGQFYGEFLRYTGGDKQGLGIVLTPRHLTELFVKMAQVTPHDTVIDTCCGTGGFLIAAMAEMDAQVGADEAARENIRETVASGSPPLIDASLWQSFKIFDLFDPHSGRQTIRRDLASGSTPLVTASDWNNGISGFIDAAPDWDGGQITLASNGSVGATFYQRQPFCASTDVTVLNPKEPLSVPAALFVCAILRREGGRFNYARKWTMGRMQASEIKLPSKNGQPDYGAMENLMASLSLGWVLNPEPA